MKKNTCFIVCFFLLVAPLQAASVSSLELKGHTEGIYCAAFSPDGKKIITGGEDGTARIWDVESGKELHKLEGHTDTVETALFLANGKQVVTESFADGIVRIWDAESGKVLHQLEGRYFASSLDGKKIIVQTWDKNDRLIYRILNVDSGKIQTIRLPKESLVGAIPIFMPDETKAVSPDGRRMVTVTQNENGISTVQVWDTESGRALRKLGEAQRRLPLRRNAGQEEVSTIHAAIFSPDGKKIATQSWDETIQIWDADKGTALLKLEGFSADYSPDGTSIVTASAADEDVVRLWDANTGKKIAEIEGALDLKFSPDGKKIMTQSLEEGTRIWDVQSGKELYKLVGFPESFSPDSKKIVTTDEGTTRILDTDSGKELKKLAGSYLAFSPDGRRIATATRNAARIWTVADSAGEAVSGNTNSVVNAVRKLLEGYSKQRTTETPE